MAGDHDGGNRWWLTGILQSDVTVLRMAGEQYEAAADAQAGALAARRSLDGQLRAMSGWPRPEDYLQMSFDYQAAGRTGEAALLRVAAATAGLQAEARARWNHRYSGRPAGTADEMITTMADSGMISFDPDGPFRGIDGASYRPGTLMIVDCEYPVVVVGTRAGVSLAVDWADYAAMAGWIAGRGSTASGPVAPPATPEGHRFRPWREEQVLGRMLHVPGEVPALAATLPPDTFTSDVRYDIYAAILAVTSRGLPPSPERVATELRERMAWVPDHALPLYGGPAGATAQAYLSRLASSTVPGDEAIAAAGDLHREDAQCRAHRLRHSPERAEDPGPRPSQVPEHASWLAVSGPPMPEGSATAAPPIAQQQLPPAGCTTPPGPGLRPPEQPRPGGPSIQM